MIYTIRMPLIGDDGESTGRIVMDGGKVREHAVWLVEKLSSRGGVNVKVFPWHGRNPWWRSGIMQKIDALLDEES
jgi:hypothetical protein